MKISRSMTHSFVFICVYLGICTSLVYSQDRRVAVPELKNKFKLKKDTAKAAHRTRVERDWKRAKKITKRGGKAAVKAVKLFLKKYKRHERGNPLEAQAQELLDELEYRGGSSGSSGGGRGKAGIKWVKIPAGSFMTGSHEYDNEKPVHKVTLKSFLISKTEVSYLS